MANVVLLSGGLGRRGRLKLVTNSSVCVNSVLPYLYSNQLTSLSVAVVHCCPCLPKRCRGGQRLTAPPFGRLTRGITMRTSAGLTTGRNLCYLTHHHQSRIMPGGRLTPMRRLSMTSRSTFLTQGTLTRLTSVTSMLGLVTLGSAPSVVPLGLPAVTRTSALTCTLTCLGWG